MPPRRTQAADRPTCQAKQPIRRPRMNIGPAHEHRRLRVSRLARRSPNYRARQSARSLTSRIPRGRSALPDCVLPHSVIAAHDFLLGKPNHITARTLAWASSHYSGLRDACRHYRVPDFRVRPVSQAASSGARPSPPIPDRTIAVQIKFGWRHRCSPTMDASERTFTGLSTMNHQNAQQGAGCQRTPNVFCRCSRLAGKRKELEERSRRRIMLVRDEGYQENKISGADQNKLGKGTSNNKPNMYDVLEM